MKLTIALMLNFVLIGTAFASLDVYPTYINFGTVNSDYSNGARRYVTIRNNDNEELSLSISNSCYFDFNVFDRCYYDLAPGQSCELSIDFRPRRDGYRSCYVRINARSPLRSYYKSISISGRGESRRP